MVAGSVFYTRSKQKVHKFTKRMYMSLNKGGSAILVATLILIWIKIIKKKRIPKK